jgi:hypothetical protein
MANVNCYMFVCPYVLRETRIILILARFRLSDLQKKMKSPLLDSETLNHQLGLEPSPSESKSKHLVAGCFPTMTNGEGGPRRTLSLVWCLWSSLVAARGVVQCLSCKILQR